MIRIRTENDQDTNRIDQDTIRIWSGYEEDRSGYD